MMRRLERKQVRRGRSLLYRRHLRAPLPPLPPTWRRRSASVAGRTSTSTRADVALVAPRREPALRASRARGGVAARGRSPRRRRRRRRLRRIRRAEADALPARLHATISEVMRLYLLLCPPLSQLLSLPTRRTS
ncbi:Os09g0491376 [Oryza sativa Japonica Group]|uniref:Os09g0491376 protein n=1 Tax=Oryza sativa subsp. japonica TaxID=39947 RepID=A0A0P0XNH5_ORYSJ|nr:hypothetical protein DAI22_09g147250 [Oryza sativa Japonica Group]BAT08731.1 Os09g0491376 [Oryza sativa Japonica Group]